MANIIAIFSLTVLSTISLDVSAFTTPPAPLANETHTIYNSTMNSDGICVCQIQAPATVQCTTVTDYGDDFDILEKQIVRLSMHLTQQQEMSMSRNEEVNELMDTINTVLETVKKIEDGDIVITIPEFEQLRQEIADLEALILVLQENNQLTDEALALLQEEIANITSALMALQGSEYEFTQEIMDSINDLKQRLLDCQSGEDLGRHRFEQLELEGIQDSCSSLDRITNGYTLQAFNTEKAVWFRDPIVNQEKIYASFLTNERSNTNVITYDTTMQFIAKEYNLRHELGDAAQGTGTVAYNGSFYYGKYNSASIAKYDYQRGVPSPAVALPTGTRFNNGGPYRSGSYSDLDFAVDETGLWLIYTTLDTGGLISLSKVDPVSLQFTRTWTTSYGKSNAGNCFIICQILYCTNNYVSHSDYINFYYDTKTEEEGFLNIPIDSRYGGVYSLDYNPYDQKLYAWDDAHAVVYDIGFKNDQS